MTDRELLELAAKAAGIAGEWRRFSGFRFLRGNSILAFDFFGRGAFFVNKEKWNPLEDDGEALRLAVKLGIAVRPCGAGGCCVETTAGFVRTERGYANTEAATRRAIVRAAAEIGKETA